MYRNHCQPCPAGIDIREVNRLLDLVTVSPRSQVRQAYRLLDVNALDCQVCGDCMRRCPFGVDVIRKMETAIALCKS